MKTGIEIIAEERQRQIEEKKFTAEGADPYHSPELAIAGACYAMPEGLRSMDVALTDIDGSVTCVDFEELFPWQGWWKPTPNNRIKELAKSGALIAAEIDRIQRLTAPATEPGSQYGF